MAEAEQVTRPVKIKNTINGAVADVTHIPPSDV